MRFADTGLQIIDGDRGTNYPNKSEFHKSGYCLFLNTGNVTKAGFSFNDVDFISEEKNALLRKGKAAKNDIVLTTRGTVGNVAFVSPTIPFEHIRINSGMVLIRSDPKKIDPYYLYSFLRSNLFQKQVLSNGSGSAQPQLPIGAFKNIAFPLPQIETQQKIAATISALDDKIYCNNRINAELEAIIKSLYDYWFVQFDFPDANGKPYKSSGGKMIYNATLNREIPAGWGNVSLENWIDQDKTGDWGKEMPEGNHLLEVICVRGTDIRSINEMGSVTAPTRFILEKNKAKILAPFDFVVEISGGSPTQSTGRVLAVTDPMLKRFTKPAICSNFCKAFSLKNQSLFFNFLYEWMSVYENGVLFGWEGKTSGIKNLLFDSFIANHQVPKPSDETSQRFFDFVSPIHAEKHKLLAQNAELETIRDWLLPMLMNGQVTVT